MTRLKPVPIGSTNTRSLKPSHDSSLGMSRGGIRGNVPSAGSATRFGPSAPMWRYADDAPGPPLKTKVTGRSTSVGSATYDTENISATGRSFFRSTTQFARGDILDRRLSTAPRRGRLGAGWRGMVDLRDRAVRRLVFAHRSVTLISNHGCCGIRRSRKASEPSALNTREPAPTRVSTHRNVASGSPRGSSGQTSAGRKA